MKSDLHDLGSLEYTSLCPVNGMIQVVSPYHLDYCLTDEEGGTLIIILGFGVDTTIRYIRLLFVIMTRCVLHCSNCC